MTDSRLADQVEKAAEKATEAAAAASENRGLLTSLRNQTEAQWEQIRQVQENSIRQSTILERVVKDQESLAEAIKEVEAVANDYRSDKKALGIVKWFAGLGGGAGVVAALKGFWPPGNG